MSCRCLLRLACLTLALGVGIRTAQADLLTTSFFFNTVDRYNDQTGALVQTGFLTPPTSGPGDFLGLAGIAVNSANNQVFVSGRFSDRIYVFNGITGQPVPAAQTPTGIAGVFKQLPAGTQPAGLAFDASHNLYVANNGGATVSEFNSSTGAVINTISSALMAAPSGLTFDSSGKLYISNLSGTNLLRYDPTTSTVSQFATVNGATFMPFVPNGVIVDGTGKAYEADVFGDGIFKYAANGTEITGGGPSAPFISVVLPPPGVASPSSTANAPSGLLFDASGNVLVAALGKTNPFNPSDSFLSNGALLRYSPTGTLLQTLGTKLPPYSGLAFAPSATNLPEPASVLSFLLCGAAAAAGYRMLRRSRPKAKLQRS